MLTLCCCQDVEDSVEYSKGDNYHGIQSIRTGSTRSIWVSSTVPTTAAATARGYMATTISTIAITTTMATATTRQSRATNGCTSNNATAVSTTAAMATATTRQSRATNGCTSNAAARVSLSFTADDDATTGRQREHSTTPTWLFRACVVLHLYWLVGRIDLAQCWVFLCADNHRFAVWPGDAESAPVCPYTQACKPVSEHQYHREYNKYQHWWSTANKLLDSCIVLHLCGMVGRVGLVMACLWDVRLHPDHAGWDNDVQYTACCHHSAEKLAR